MKQPLSTQPIAAEALRIGMFIHLDGGWMSHPFPLSSFKISADSQIATLRELGLKLRWCPEQSEPEAPADADAEAIEAAASPYDQAAPVSLSAEAQSQLDHREALTDQREAQAVCERQFSEAAKACKAMVDMVPT